MEHNAPPGRPSEARARMLETAIRVFYANGIHSVGIDRIVAEAQVTRATLYRHFSGKEELVVAYLQEVDRAIRAQADQAQANGAAAADAVRALSRSITRDIRSPGFRGCAFLNAVAEYPDPGSPVHQTVLAHRRWFQDTVSELLGRIRQTPADTAARHFVMMRDGAMAAGCLLDPTMVGDTFLQGVEGLLQVYAAATTAVRPMPDPAAQPARNGRRDYDDRNQEIIEEFRRSAHRVGTRKVRR